jgi:hypothetical protein
VRVRLHVDLSSCWFRAGGFIQGSFRASSRKLLTAQSCISTLAGPSEVVRCSADEGLGQGDGVYAVSAMDVVAWQPRHFVVSFLVSLCALPCCACQPLLLVDARHWRLQDIVHWKSNILFIGIRIPINNILMSPYYWKSRAGAFNGSQSVARKVCAVIKCVARWRS